METNDQRGESEKSVILCKRKNVFTKGIPSRRKFNGKESDDRLNFPLIERIKTDI